MALGPREWVIAQAEPGPVNNVIWVLIDTTNQFVRGQAYSRDLAQSIVDFLNGAQGQKAQAVRDALDEVDKATQGHRLDYALLGFYEALAAACHALLD